MRFQDRRNLQGPNDPALGCARCLHQDPCGPIPACACYHPAVEEIPLFHRKVGGHLKIPAPSWCPLWGTMPKI